MINKNKKTHPFLFVPKKNELSTFFRCKNNPFYTWYIPTYKHCIMMFMYNLTISNSDIRKS